MARLHEAVVEGEDHRGGPVAEVELGEEMADVGLDGAFAEHEMAGDLGAILGPVVAGAIADASGYGPAFVVSAVVALVPLPFVIAARETLVPQLTAEPVRD